MTSLEVRSPDKAADLRERRSYSSASTTAPSQPTGSATTPRPATPITGTLGCRHSVSDSRKVQVNPVAVLVVGGRILVGAECVQAGCGRVAGHRREFLPGDEPAPPPDGHQFPDLVAVTGDGERLPVLDGVHDLP